MKNDIDGELLAIIDFGIVKDDQIVRDTVQRMDPSRAASERPNSAQ